MWQHVEAKRHVFPAALGPTSKTWEIEAPKTVILGSLFNSEKCHGCRHGGSFFFLRYTTVYTYRQEKQRFKNGAMWRKNAADTWLQMCSYAVPNPKSRVYCPGFLKKGRSMSRSKRNHFQESNAPWTKSKFWCQNGGLGWGYSHISP